MENSQLRDKMILLITEKLIDAGLKQKYQISAFNAFCRSNPILLVDAILEGKQLTGQDKN